MKYAWLLAFLLIGCGPIAPLVEDCGDGVDNDNDTLADCDDPSCEADAACLPEDCSDGADNNGDGLIDCADPKCEQTTTCKELSCNDAADNDQDGDFDCADADCDADPACQEAGNCADNRDNDLDSLEDCQDADCAEDTVCVGVEICLGGLDEDSDGLVDCADPDCAAAVNCIVGVELCTGNLDEDNDGLIDCADPDCFFDLGCLFGFEVCSGGLDEDNDGLIDCQDPGCFADPLCTGAEVCNNGQDDDGDGRTDCVDLDCEQSASCPESCSNGQDDDGDGRIDCSDGFCSQNAACNTTPTVTANCPQELFIAPGQLASLSGSVTTNGAINTAQTLWSLTVRPAGSTSVMSATTQAAGQFNASFTTTPAINGDYTATFTARLTTGQQDTCTTVVHTQTQGLRLALTWSTPTADVDLHLLHPTATRWFDSVLDCQFTNCSAGGLSWPAAGTGDDPRLEIDDVEGFGPEVTVLDQPELNTANGYRVGAYMFSADADNALSIDLTLQIFCAGVLKQTLTHVDLNGGASNAPPNELWKAADIRFTSASVCNVTVVDQLVQTGSSLNTPR